MGSITGRIGGSVFGYDLDFQASPTGLSGRIGGLVGGANLEVRVGDSGQVSGRMAGAVAGKDVSGLLSGSCFEGRIGGGVVGNDVRLERAGDHIAGRRWVCRGSQLRCYLHAGDWRPRKWSRRRARCRSW